MPPLFDEYWEPFWAACEERGIAVVVHAGFGTEHGARVPRDRADLQRRRGRPAGSTDRDALFEHADAVSEESLEFFNDFLNHNVDSRRPMWQLMLGGVFDRHPGLKLHAHRDPPRLDPGDPAPPRRRSTRSTATDLPAKRTPSEYWHANCLAGASFIHKVEVEMRHEIGVDTILFGRDFPHPESTWPQHPTTGCGSRSPACPRTSSG